MIGLTLSRYFFLQFLRWIAGLMLLAFCMLFLFDFLELVRRIGDRGDLPIAPTMLMSLFRVPSLVEQALPFAVLFGAIGAYRGLSKRLELVVARSAGVSVWQFSMPGLVFVLVIGIVTVIGFNPLSAYLKRLSDEIGVQLFGAGQRVLIQTTRESWLRQDGVDGESILHARQSLDQGRRLFDVTLQTFNEDGGFRQRIEAKKAILVDNRWRLDDVIVFDSDGRPTAYERYFIPTFLSAEQIRESFAAPDTVSFWQLPAFIELAQRSGLDAYEYRMQYQTLLSRPLLLVAMVLIAATVSLRFSRFGAVMPLILGGIIAGFVLYVVTEVTKDLGGVGIVPPIVAAWSPGIVATLMGFTILLNQEDG